MMFTTERVEYLKSYIQNLRVSFWGKLFYNYIPFRKQVVLSNLNQVFHQVLTQDEIKKLAIGFYTHFATSLHENIKLRFMSKEKIKSFAVIKGHEKLLHSANDKNAPGGLILTGHFGNWEFSPLAGMLNFEKYHGRIYFIRKALKVKFLEKLVFKQFYNAGLRILKQKHALRDVFDVLNKNNLVIFVLDQHACLDKRKGIEVDFFGKKAATHKSLAMIAGHSGAPVTPACSYRTSEGKHVLQFGEPLTWLKADDPKQEIYLNTKAYNEELEKMILDHPEQWLWIYKRWKPWKPFNIDELNHG